MKEPKTSKKKGQRAVDDILEEAREQFDLCVEAEADNRKDALDDIRFARLSEQWPDDVRKAREREGRPCLTVNRLPAFIRQVVNDCRKNKPSIKVHAANSDASAETAEILNGLIRNIEYTSSADVVYDTAVESAIVGGFGYIRVSVDFAHDDAFDLDLCIERVANPFTVYGDPHSQAADSSDWNVAFVTERMSKDEFERRYKGAEAVDWEDTGYGSLKAPWYDEDTVQVAEYWTREEVARSIVQLNDGSVMDKDVYEKHAAYFTALGKLVVNERETRSHKVTQRIITGAEVLETNEWTGRYIPIVPVYGDEINVEGKRYFRSFIRDAKDPQRMFNFWRTASTELVALAPKVPFIGPKGAFRTDASKWATANTQSHAYIEYDGPMAPERQPYAGAPAGALQEALNASDDIKASLGMFDAALGSQGNETSGKAILARQRESDTGTFHFVDNLSRAIRHTGRILLDLIPHVYSQERIIRVIGKDGTPENVKIGPAPEAPPPVDMGMPPQMPMPGMPPGMMPPPPPPPGPEGMDKVYDLTAGKYDLVVESGPSFATQREEAANQMLEMLRVFPQAADIAGDLFAKNLDWPGADDIAKRLEQAMATRQQGNPELAQAHQQIAEMQTALNVYQSKLAQLQAEKTINQLKAQADAYKAETDRLQALAPAFGPAEIMALVQHTVQQALAGPSLAQPNTVPVPVPQPAPVPPMPPQGSAPPPPQGGPVTVNNGGQAPVGNPLQQN